jgi:class 3 adenylate cyclase/tetratricopeptide (TPR) repeat protein
MADDIAQWLDGLGLGKYAQAFTENGVELQHLPHLTDDDLKELGLPLGPRRHLQAAIETLSADQPSIRPTVPSTREPEVRPADAERRQLTVMFCDLVGSTALSERLDPEDLREVLRVYREACHAVIDRFEGHIANYIGDGLLIYFGYPQAHEDDAARSVHAALCIVAEIGNLGQRFDWLEGIELGVRVGIHTGLVVAGDIGSGEVRESQGIVGETPNIAARLEALTAPNTVVISDSTWRLVEGLFLCDDLGPQELKGISQPVAAHRVREESGAHGRFEAITAAGLTPLVGRESEIDLLLDRWDLAKDGEGQVVLLSGEAGVGKSRILRGVRDRLDDKSHTRILYYGSPYHRNSALYPVVDQLERGLRFQRDDDLPRKLDKLEKVLADLKLPVDQHAPVLALLLSLAADDRYGPVELSPEELKNRMLDAVLAIIETMSVRAPVLMLVEDLHWIDPSTLEFLHMLVERLRRSRILFVGTARPEFDNPWGDHAHVTALTLNRLSRRESAMLIGKVTHGKSLPDEVLDQIIAKTDGVPLFVEELTKTVLESDLLENAGDRFVLSGPLPSLAIPASLQDSLMARLDRLAAVKEVAQLAAALGRSFRRDVLVAVSSLDELTLDDALAKLAAAGLVYRRGMPPDVTYEFKHALVQDTAYQSLLKSRRQEFHLKIAMALDERFPEIAENEPEVLAHHAFQGEVWDKAVSYFRQAGAKAAARSAYREAVTCLEQALGALTHLPESRETLELGIDLRLDLRNSLHPLGEHQRLFDHVCAAEPLAERIDDQRRLGWISAYMATYFAMSGEPDRAVQSGQRALDIAKALEEFPLQVAANFRLGLAYLTSDYRRASDFFGSNVESLQGKLVRERFGEVAPASVLSRIWLVVSLAELGKYVEGIARGEEGVRIAEAVNQPWSLIGAYYSVGSLYLRKGDLTKAISLLERALELSQAYPLFWLPWISSSLGYAYALSERAAEALPLLEQGIEQAASKKQWRFYPLQAVYLSEAYRLAGRPDDAISLASQALESARDYRARGQEAWALWNLGELGLHCDPPDAERTAVFYRQALALADELGMSPLAAHCHHGLGTRYRLTEQPERAHEHLDAARTLYCEMDMRYWIERTGDVCR